METKLRKKMKWKQLRSGLKREDWDSLEAGPRRVGLEEVELLEGVQIEKGARVREGVGPTEVAQLIEEEVELIEEVESLKIKEASGEVEEEDPQQLEVEGVGPTVEGVVPIEAEARAKVAGHKTTGQVMTVKERETSFRIRQHSTITTATRNPLAPQMITLMILVTLSLMSHTEAGESPIGGGLPLQAGGPSVAAPQGGGDSEAAGIMRQSGIIRMSVSPEAGQDLEGGDGMGQEARGGGKMRRRVGRYLLPGGGVVAVEAGEGKTMASTGTQWYVCSQRYVQRQ